MTAAGRDVQSCCRKVRRTRPAQEADPRVRSVEVMRAQVRLGHECLFRVVRAKVRSPELVELALSGGFCDDRNPSAFGSQADTLAGENFLQPATAKIGAPPRSKFLRTALFRQPPAGRSAGFSPLRMRSTSSAGRWLRIRSRFQQIHWAWYNAQGCALAVT